MPTDTLTAPAPTAALSREQLRTFHLTGHAPADHAPDDDLRPSIFTGADLPNLEASYPMCVHPDGAVRPFRDLVKDLENAGIITSAFRMALGDQPSMPLDAVARIAIDSLHECSGAELARLRKLLPAGAFLASYHAETLVLLHAAALATARKAARSRFWESVKHTAEQMREMLLVDKTHAPDAVSPKSVSASLGSRVTAFFKPVSLARALQRPANPLQCMDPSRKSRCESTLATLEEALRGAATDPAFFLYPPAKLASDLSAIHGVMEWADDGFAAAMELCDFRLERITELLRALRVARLEVASSYDPAIHDEMIARFDWQSASPEELAAVPPIIVLETAERLAQASLTSFGRLLRSGRPVQILITRAGLGPRDLAGFAPDFGYLSIAHRESFVLQSSMAQPAHLLDGLAVMAKSQRTAVAIVSTPSDSESWLAETVLVASRAAALFLYDPDAGSHWAERFRLEVPPASELTSVDAAAVSTTLRGQFCIIPASAWNNDQMELADYLKAYQSRPPLAIPYIWVEGDNSTRNRALISRDLANYCVDRRRAWELFAELSEIGKPQIAPPARNDNARQEGARDAIQQVIRMLAEA